MAKWSSFPYDDTDYSQTTASLKKHWRACTPVTRAAAEGGRGAGRVGAVPCR